MLHRWTARDRSRRFTLASLARVLLDTAEAGDPAAIEIVRQHGQALGRYALAAARRVGIADGGFPLALAGGVFRHRSRLLSDALLEAARADAAEVSVVWPDLPPAAGALLLAFDGAGIAVDATVDARLRSTLPPDAIFDTLA